jgi:hypothetical protein
MVGVYVGLFTLAYSQNEDMGIFLSETSFIANGKGVYSEIFEVKDPLFLWLGGLTNWVFGLSGPYLLDVLFVIVSPLVAFKFARTLQLTQTWSIIVGISFCGSLGGIYYQTLRTGTIALVLVVLALTFAVKREWFTTGILCALVVGFKMAYAPILIGIAFYLICSPNKFKSISNFLFGALSTSTLILSGLWWRGELHGFVDMVTLNFHYREIFPKAVGFRPGIMGHIDIINGNSSSFTWLIITLTVLVTIVLVLFRKNRQVLLINITLSLTFVGVLVFLLASAMWIHHLQPLSIISLVTMSILGKLDGFRRESSLNYSWFFAPILILSVISINTTGWKIPVKPLSPVSTWFSPRWTTPPEADYLQKNSQNFRLKKDFARLGPNDDLGLAAFLPSDWNLVCRDYAHYGHETSELVSEILKCIQTKPNYVLISPGFFALTRLSGTYEQLKKSSSEVLGEYYECVAIEQRAGAQFCTRIKSGLN